MAKGHMPDGSDHAGHRQRVKERFLREGLEKFTPREILELILFYAIPQGDVNPVADALLDTFGTLNAVLSADLPSLQRVRGVGGHTALLLSLFLPVFRYYHVANMGDSIVLDSATKAGQYVQSLFLGCQRERFYLICLNSRAGVLRCVQFDQGTASEIAVPPRLLVEATLSSNATQVIFAHNHPGGLCKPSLDDELFTRRMMVTLTPLDIPVIDHIVVSDAGFYSFHKEGRMEDIKKDVQIRIASAPAFYRYD